MREEVNMNTRKSTKNLFLLTFLLLSSSELAYSGNKYRIVGKFGKHYIWRIGGKMHLASFNLARDPLTQYTKCYIGEL